ncbi:hypothetical protein ABTX35_28910 [Streptomyces sp. NPDC096080]|uniref:hypothetical protein n=1 Tax=Streptomyces sp. NPDC096080 TaxID=3156693 RepID=UPI003328B9C1
MALARSWAVGLVVLVLTERVLTSLVRTYLTDPEGVGSFGAALTLVHLPDLVCVTLASWAAARVHPEPVRRDPVRHAAAACAVPAAALALALALRPHSPAPAGTALWMSTAVLLAGCAAGLLLDKLVWTS